MLIALALDPFSRPLIQIKTVFVYTKLSRCVLPLPRTTSYVSGRLTETGPRDKLYGSTEEYSQVKAEIDPALEASILDGLFNNNTRLGGRRLYMPCQGGQCRWPNFITAGVCNKCNDITSKLTRYDNWALSTPIGSPTGTFMSAYFLPNGAFLVNLDGDFKVTNPINIMNDYFEVIGSGLSFQMMGFATGDPAKTASMRELKTLIWSLSAVRLNWLALAEKRESNYTLSWPNIPVIATECALYYCGLEIASKVTNGTLFEIEQELELIFSPDSYQVTAKALCPTLPTNFSDSLEFDPITSAIGRTDLKLQSPRNASEVFSFGADTVKSISSYFQSTFQPDKNLTNRMGPESVTVTLQSAEYPSGRTNLAIAVASGLPPKCRAFWLGYLDVPEKFGVLARSMTDAMRTSGFQQLHKPGDVNPEFGEQETVYMVQWGWMTLHIVVIVGGTAFYIATVVSASKAEKAFQCLARKNSSLAVNSKASELGASFEPSDSVEELERKARVLTASFDTEDERLAL